MVVRETCTVAAIALVQAGLYDRRRRSYVPMRTLLAAIGIAAEAPPMSDAVEAFLAADRALRDTTAPV